MRLLTVAAMAESAKRQSDAEKLANYDRLHALAVTMFAWMQREASMHDPYDGADKCALCQIVRDARTLDLHLPALTPSRGRT